VGCAGMDEDALPALMPETHAALQSSAAKTADLREYLAARGAGGDEGEAMELCSERVTPQPLARRQGTGRVALPRRFSLRWG